MQALSSYILEVRPGTPREDDYLVYSCNRFTACRFGLGAVYIDPATGSHLPLRDHIVYTLGKIAPYAAALGSRPMADYLLELPNGTGNDASWIRTRYRAVKSFQTLMMEQARRWAQNDPILGL